MSLAKGVVVGIQAKRHLRFSLPTVGEMPEGAPYVGTVPEALDFAQKHKVDTVILPCLTLIASS